MSKEIIEDIKEILKGVNRLLIYNNICDNNLFNYFINFLKKLNANNHSEDVILDNYFRLSSQLLKYGENKYDNIPGDYWKNFILNFILADDNVFTKKAVQKDFNKINSSLIKAVKNDLIYLEKLFKIDWKLVKNYIQQKINSSNKEDIYLPDWKTSGDINWNFKKMEFKKLLDDSNNWQGMIKKLALFYQENGTGTFNSYKAFTWDHKINSLIGIENIDNISFEEIIGYNNQKKEIKDNTEKLLNGYRANNVLLYGDKGTGKSSTIKAVLNKYWSQGLRLIDLNKENFKQIPKIIEKIQDFKLAFVLFIDDLSFTQGETSYKDLKATLEGRSKQLPQNMVIYATSNKRHLVREDFSNYDNQVRKQDAMQEKLSLADRFGITLIYTQPSQQEYLNIVESLAENRDIKINKDELQERAKKWALKQNGRSGRTARQFIDYLEGE